MQTRLIMVAIIAFALGLLIGSTLPPISLRPSRSPERDNAVLREEVPIYKQKGRGVPGRAGRSAEGADGK
jgi:hypothetical protein